MTGRATRVIDETRGISIDGNFDLATPIPDQTGPTVNLTIGQTIIDLGIGGRLFDLPLGGAGRPSIDDIDDFDGLTGRTIATGRHCFGCTAGAGSGCAGALRPRS